MSGVKDSLEIFSWVPEQFNLMFRNLHDPHLVILKVGWHVLYEILKLLEAIQNLMINTLKKSLLKEQEHILELSA